MFHALLLFAHILGIIAAISAMFVSENIIYRKYDRFSSVDVSLVGQLSNVIKISLLILWLSGFGLIYLGYQSNPLFLANEKIWAKIVVVSIITLNGFYISRRIMPRIKMLSHTRTLVNSYFESFMFRLSFAVSVSGWLVAMFFGIARFMNNSFSMYYLLYGFCSIVGLVLLISFVFRKVEFLRPNRPKPRQFSSNHFGSKSVPQ